jgi:hypothetical protein
MSEFLRAGVGVRLPASLLLGVAFGVAACGAAGAGRHQAVGFGVFCGLAVAVGWFARDVRSALVVGPVLWLFLDGFVEHRAGALGWGGVSEAGRLALLVVIAVLPSVIRGLSGAVRLRFRRGSVEVFTPTLPPGPSTWN